MSKLASLHLGGNCVAAQSWKFQICRDGVALRPCVWDRRNSPHTKSFDKQIVCMAHPRRVKMVQQQIHRELADMLLHDTVLQQAIAPESSLGADMYLSSVATISDVEISKDLQVAKVFVSIYGDEREQEIALEGLKSKSKYVRMGLGKRMSLRMTPEVRFVKDESLERGSRVLDLLDRVKQDRERKESGDTSPSQLITPVDDDDDFDLDFEEKDETPIAQKPKKKSKTKAPPKAAAKKVAADDNDFDWDDEEFRDLDFNDDENIIFIK
ncbi:hypothetical protein M758_4G200100 [Ceratodon purpureus]|nr:hypothetical protein M758_4G200100 [Ceratodon purpureus]